MFRQENPGRLGSPGQEGKKDRRSLRFQVGDPGRDYRQAALYRGRYRRAGDNRLPAGTGPVYPRADGDHVRRSPLDGSPVCRLLHRRRIERLLQAQPRGRPAGTVRGLRPGHASRLRFGPSTGGWRRRQGRCGDRLGRGHEDPVRQHPPRQGVGIDDHERRRAADHGQLYRRCRGTGRRPGTAGRDHPERYPQGVHGPQHLHLSAGTLDADYRRHHRVHQSEDAALQLDFDLRLPHPGSRRQQRSGTRLHSG